jgi:glyoxylase-like metal-dependent hydrolase (beta-lactamase superfamily II)
VIITERRNAIGTQRSSSVTNQARFHPSIHPAQSTHVREWVMALQIRSFFHEPTHSVTYLVWDGASRRAGVIDAVLDYDAAAARTSTTFVDHVVDTIVREGLTLDWILETHAHADHVTAAQVLKDKAGGLVVIGAGIEGVQRTFKDIFALDDLVPDGSQFDRLVIDGEHLPLGDLTIEVLATPGHTPSFSSYKIDDAVFVGDTLLMPDYGTARADFPGGDAATLYRSIRRLLSLPPATRMFVGHDYKAEGRDVFAWESTVAEQRAHNVHIHQGIDEKAFVKLRTERDKRLTLPALMLPAMQINVRGGQLPPPAANGMRYLKIALNQF